MDMFIFDDYKKFIEKVLKAKGHGSRLKFANALKCQSAYITRVLNQDAHLSLEQAADGAHFFGLSQEEEEFFLLLVQKAKAGTKRLEDIHAKKIKAIREKRTLFSNRMNETLELDEVTQAQYYSRWYYAAVHMIVTIPSLRSKEAIHDYLGLRMEVVNEAIQFLESAGLIAQTVDGYSTGRGRVFLKGDSPFIVQHHENWRLKSLDSILNSQKENLHFSSVYTLSKSDFVSIKEKILTHIQEIRDIVKPSKEEELCVLNLDFFKLKD